VAERLDTDYLYVSGMDDEEERKKWFTRFFDLPDIK
jgi:hypothetical protein